MVQGMTAGQVSGECTASAQAGSVSFGLTFSKVPYVTATIISGSTAQGFGVNTHTITTTGFSYVKTYIMSGSSAVGGAGCESFNWIAVVV